MSYIADITEAVKDALNAAGSGDLSETVEAIRVAVPERDYTGVTDDLTVWVIGRAADMQRVSRGDLLRTDVEVNVIFAKKIGQLSDTATEGGNAEVDAMVGLGEEIAEFIAGDRKYAGFTCQRVEYDPVFDFEILRTHRVFVGVVRAFIVRF